MTSTELAGRVAIVTGANHGIGAATAAMLARMGAGVLVTYLRLDVTGRDESGPSAYDVARAADGSGVIEAIRASEGTAEALEADLSDPVSAALLFDTAEARLGPVSILVNNASGWRQDTFAAGSEDRFGRKLRPVTPETFASQFLVDARASALLISELSRRHVARKADWGRIVSLTSGSADGFPSEASYGAAKAALVNYTLTAARELGQYGITANVVHPPITDTGWVTPEVETVARESSPFGVADPAQVANAIGLLMSRAADRVTANVIRML